MSQAAWCLVFVWGTFALFLFKEMWRDEI